LFEPILQIGSFRFTALHFHAEGAFLILDDRKRTHPHFQLLFELLKRGFVILKLYSHVVFANYWL